ncbi:MAG TPA: Imm74 family immunity protein [Beijerinckia sp.]|jgi:hypothetical protein|nr:Imm74 family immunity protein [Beijerinckia sp.]
MANRRQTELKVELTEGAIRVIRGDRVLTLISGAGLPNEEELADFVVCLDDIAHWDAPHENIEIGIEELQKIVEVIEDEFDRRGLKLEFD